MRQANTRTLNAIILFAATGAGPNLMGGPVTEIKSFDDVPIDIAAHHADDIDQVGHDGG